MYNLVVANIWLSVVLQVEKKFGALMVSIFIIMFMLSSIYIISIYYLWEFYLSGWSVVATVDQCGQIPGIGIKEAQHSIVWLQQLVLHGFKQITIIMSLAPVMNTTQTLPFSYDKCLSTLYFFFVIKHANNNLCINS